LTFISFTKELQDNGEHSALLPAEKVTTSYPSSLLEFDLTTLVVNEESGLKGFHPAGS